METMKHIGVVTGSLPKEQWVEIPHEYKSVMAELCSLYYHMNSEKVENPCGNITRVALLAMAEEVHETALYDDGLGPMRVPRDLYMAIGETIHNINASAAELDMVVSNARKTGNTEN